MAPYTDICQYCGGDMDGLRVDAAFCSVGCKNNWHNLQKRADRFQTRTLALIDELYSELRERDRIKLAEIMSAIARAAAGSIPVERR